MRQAVLRLLPAGRKVLNKFRDNSIAGFLKRHRFPWLIVLAVIAIASMIPYFILGENSIVTYHDQLDGELVTYLLNAKHLFDGVKIYPEIMNGIPREGLVSPAPFFVLFFKIFKPFTAFLICMFIVRIVSALYMFLFLDELTSKKFISFTLAILFMLLPFYTVYGLSIPGQPIVYYAFLRFKKDKFEWYHYFEVLLYVACSSFALCGFAVIFVCGVGLLISFFSKNGKALRYLIALLTLLFGFLLENISLLGQFFGFGNSFISHKEEMVRTGTPFFEGLFNLLSKGADYTHAYQLYYLPIIAISLIFGGVFVFMTAGDKDDIEKTYYTLLIGAGIILTFAVITAFVGSPVVVNVLNKTTGFLHDFNFTRFSWLFTVFWFAEFALSLKMLWIMVRNMDLRIFGIILYVIGFVGVTGVTGFFILKDNDLKPNILKLANNGNYEMMTWKQYFAEDLFSEVDKMIGGKKQEVKVVSYGIYPAAATYNGFNCLDAYSNNYDLNYKHAFREVIAPELDKSDYLKQWFDGWGNRCVLVTNENMNYFTFEKKWGTYTTSYDFNIDALKNLGCDYIISASYFIEPESHGLKLLNENDEAIETPDSWYRLFVYEIEKNE